MNIQIRKETEELEIQEKSFEELKEVRDVLLNGQSKLLEQVVKKVFNEFGIAFVEGPTGRDDLILRDESNQTILVSEVKGLKNSASEGDARQLNQWCDRVFEEEKHEPKGLLLVNAWREKEPTDRNEAIFTDQMLPYCNKREFCLMTTIQLFNMWCAFKRGEFKGGDELLNQIIETVGVFPGFDDPSENRIK